MYKKVILKILIIVVIALFFTLLISSINDEVVAVSRSEAVGNGIIYGNQDKNSQSEVTYRSWKDTLKNNNKTVWINSRFFKDNDFVFCIHLGQNISFDNWPLEYTIGKKITIEGSTDPVLNGLAYILNQPSGRNITSEEQGAWEQYHNDPNQLALWMYLNNYYSKINKKLDYSFVAQGKDEKKIMKENEYLCCKDTIKDKILYGGNNDNGKKAYEIYSTAKKIANGTINNTYYDAEIYILQKSGMQELMLVDTVGSKDNTKIYLEFYKTDFDEKALGNAEIEVTGNSNVSVSGTLSKSASDNGYFGKLKLTPTENNGTVKINLEEKVTPSNYKGLPSEVVLTINYNPENGRVTEITADKNSKYFKFETGTIGVIKVKNEYNPPISIKVYKRTNRDKELTGAIFTVKFEQQGTTTKTETLDMTSVSSKTTGEFTPSNKNNDITVTIRETDPPDHYNSAEEVTLTFKWDSSNKIWKIKERTDISGENSLIAFNEDTSATTRPTFYLDGKGRKVVRTRDNKVFQVKIKDDPRIIKDLTIIKKDKSEDKSGKGAVKDAIFEVYFNNITYVKIDGKKYVVEDIINESRRKNSKIEIDGKEYYKKTADGLTFLVPTEETEEDYDNRLYIEGLKTDENGQIKIDEIEAIENKDIIYVKVTETSAPKGYDILPKSAKLLLKYNNRGSNKWELFLRDGSILEEDSKNYNKLDSEYYSLESGILTLTLIDDFKIDKLTILKTDSQNSSTKLPEAKFNITLTNVKSIGSYSSGNKSRKNNIKKC